MSEINHHGIKEGKYDFPDIENWAEDDPRRDCLSWDREFLRKRYNQEAAKWYLPANEVVSLIGHPCYPHIQYAHGVALDIGCGNGSLLLNLYHDRTIKHGIGIDISDKAIEAAIKSAQNVGNDDVVFIRAAFEEFETNQIFDTIIVYDILEHLFSVTFALNKIKMLLAPGGFVIGTVPDGHACDDAALPVHLHYFDETSLLVLFQSFFKKVSISGKRISDSEYRYYFLLEK